MGFFLLNQPCRPQVRNRVPKLKQTRVFCEHFFLKLSFREIAERHGMTARQVESDYSYAFKRIRRVLEKMNARDNAIRYFRSPGKANDMTDPEKWWILNRVFGHTCVEIAEMVKNQVLSENRPKTTARGSETEHQFYPAKKLF